MKLAKLFLLTAISVMVTATSLSARGPLDLGDQQENLRGLKGVAVVVRELTENEKAVGLTEEMLRTDVELRLRKAGVPVLSGTQWSSVRGLPVLQVGVVVLKAVNGQLAHTTDVHVWEFATLLRNGLKVEAETWGDIGAGFAGTGGIREVRDGLGDRIDKFCNDYLAANEK